MSELDPVRKLIRERVRNLKEMSIEIGKNETYLQQYLTRGTPVELPERVRRLLAEKLNVPEDLLRRGSTAVLVAPRKTSERTTEQTPAKSHLEDAMWSIWSQAKPAERQLIVNIANTILASRKEP
jgi:hypothetical protein